MPKKTAEKTGPGTGPIRSVAQLEDKLSEPTPELVEFMRKLDGDLVILGVGGKVGPTLARLAARAVEASGVHRQVVGVDAFPEDRARKLLERVGIETVQADLMEPGVVERLSGAENVIYMVGRKFGSTGAEWATWMINVQLAGILARRYQESRIVAFSSGNVYPFVPVSSRGATETTTPAPLGEYAMTCLGRERMFDHYSHEAGTKVVQFRLNYAVELRYGILLDVATKVSNGDPVDVTMGHVNVVWQGYVCEVALQSLGLAESPPRILNVTGPETVSVRWLATRFGELLGKKPRIVGDEAPDALLSDAAQCFKLFGHPQVPVDTLVEWTAHWVKANGATLGKPTHYETRNGKF